jgi:hypothetical protein
LFFLGLDAHHEAPGVLGAVVSFGALPFFGVDAGLAGDPCGDGLLALPCGEAFEGVVSRTSRTLTEDPVSSVLHGSCGRPPRDPCAPVSPVERCAPWLERRESFTEPVAPCQRSPAECPVPRAGDADGDEGEEEVAAAVELFRKRPPTRPATNAPPKKSAGSRRAKPSTSLAISPIVRLRMYPAAAST